MPFPFERQRTVFRAVVCTVVPEAEALDGTAWTSLEGVVASGLARRPRRLLVQLRLFLGVIEQLPRVRYGRAFSSLSPAQRIEFCKRLERSRVFLFRKGFWGMRTIAFMGYYARPGAAADVGYRANPLGWRARADERVRS